MKLRDYIKELSEVKEELLDKEIKIVAENGLLFDPKLKFALKDKIDTLNKSADNVETLIVGY